MLLFELDYEVDVSYFKQAVNGEVPYNSDHQDIQEWEVFLEDWLAGELDERTMTYMIHAMNAFSDKFSYTGTLWRGMIVPKGYSLYPMELACFTHDKDVAKYFAGEPGYSFVTEEDLEGSDSVILRIHAEKAFALDEFLEHIGKLTQNDRLKWQIHDTDKEGEKIHPLTEDVLKQYNYI